VLLFSLLYVDACVEGNSYPLKGHKGSFYRGGLSATAIIQSSLIPVEARGSSYNGLVHVSGAVMSYFFRHLVTFFITSDWYPTIMGLATGGTWATTETIDGKDVWDAIVRTYQHISLLSVDTSNLNQPSSPSLSEYIENKSLRIYW